MRHYVLRKSQDRDLQLIVKNQISFYLLQGGVRSFFIFFKDLEDNQVSYIVRWLQATFASFIC